VRGSEVADVLTAVAIPGAMLVWPDILFTDATGQIIRKPFGPSIQRFIGYFLVEIRKKICKNKTLGHATTGALSALAVWITESFRVDSHASVAVAAAILVAVSSAAKGAFCKMTEEQLKELFPTPSRMLDALTIEDGGEETDFVGAMRMYLDHYLSETPFIESIGGEPIQTRRKPTTIEGQLAICTSDLQSYINKTFNENHSVKAVASMLAALGASSTRIRNVRLRDQSRWVLPLNEFDPKDFI
jgi:hypothetical protein